MGKKHAVSQEENGVQKLQYTFERWRSAPRDALGGGAPEAMSPETRRYPSCLIVSSVWSCDGSRWRC